MIRAFIFDLDGTLVNTIKDIGVSVNYSLKINNLPEVSLSLYPSFLGNGSKVLIKKAMGKYFVSENELFNKIYDDYLNYYANHIVDYSKAYYGMKNTLNILKIKGIDLFVITNKPDNAAKILVNTVFKKNTFKEVIGLEENTPPKPNPTIINNLLKKYNLNKEECVYVGDSDVDMILANNAKIKYKIACLYGYRDKDELLSYKPDLAIYKPIEMLKILD